jgi:hypothetical protein
VFDAEYCARWDLIGPFNRAQGESCCSCVVTVIAPFSCPGYDLGNKVPVAQRLNFEMFPPADNTHCRDMQFCVQALSHQAD